MTPLIQKIVVPTDFGPTSEHATKYAWTLASRLGASIALIHVLEDPPMAAGPFESYPLDLPGLREQRYHDAHSKLTAIVHELGPDVEVTTAVRVGPTADSITKAAVDYGADLVIMGTHGRSGLSHLVLGSVAEHVIRTASCPVLVVRDSGGVHMHRRLRPELAEFAEVDERVIAIA
jgi:nucleotide-binding universal stress UspA family protein